MGQSFAGTPLTTTEITGRLLLAFVSGALAGVERQWHHKKADGGAIRDCDGRPLPVASSRSG